MEGKKGLVGHLDFGGGPEVATPALASASQEDAGKDHVPRFPCLHTSKPRGGCSDKGSEMRRSLFGNGDKKPALRKEGGTFKSLLFCGFNKLLVVKAHQSGSRRGISSGFLACAKSSEGY